MSMHFPLKRIEERRPEKPTETVGSRLFAKHLKMEKKKCSTIIFWYFICLFVMSFSVGCSHIHPTAKHQVLSLESKDLNAYGLAFITPSTVTGQEEEMQAVAFTFAEVLKRKRPEIECITLPETLSAVNTAGMAEDYKRMYEDYRSTGLFKKDILKRVGEVTNTRYLAQLKLAGFKQFSNRRLGILGLRLIETRTATIRLFFQIWDSKDGSIVWEGVSELTYAVDTMSEKPITLRLVLQSAAEDLIDYLPRESESSVK